MDVAPPVVGGVQGGHGDAILLLGAVPALCRNAPSVLEHAVVGLWSPTAIGGLSRRQFSANALDRPPPWPTAGLGCWQTVRPLPLGGESGVDRRTRGSYVSGWSRPAPSKAPQPAPIPTLTNEEQPNCWGHQRRPKQFLGFCVLGHRAPPPFPRTVPQSVVKGKSRFCPPSCV